MVTCEQLKQILSTMGIKRAVVIDDKLDEDQEIIFDILEGHYNTPGFKISSFVEELNFGYTLDQLKEMESFPPMLVKELKKEFPGIIKSEISELLNVLSQVYEDNVHLFNHIPIDLQIDSDTILFLDYRLDGSNITSEQLANLLAKQTTSDSNPRCIVFISNDKLFKFGSDRYRMLDYKERTEYFRKLRSQNESKSYKNTVYDYVCKENLALENQTLDELYKVFQNLYGSKKFFELLNCVEDILSRSSEAVLGQFHLLNARSIQGMIKEKVIEEGISAPTFLIQWISRHIGKKVEQNEEIGSKIENILNEINEWTASYYETHEDVILREIILSEMWDKKVCERFLPVDFGDIYEIDYNNEKRRAILLTQTCTLAVRNNGKRTGRVAMLALENNEKIDRQSGITLDDWNGEKITFDLDETISIPISFLDLTTLNIDGKAIVQWEAGKDVFSSPPHALWSNGYKLMMKDFINEIARNLMKINTPMYQIDETYMPFTNESTPQLNKYEFPIKRLCRLDEQYALYVLQSAQAWWGRIGLPVNVNFMDDYKEIQGEIHAHGTVYPINFYIKRRISDIVDVGISLEELGHIIHDLYNDDQTIVDLLQEVLNKPELAHLHFASGKKILSLKSNKTGVKLLESNKIHIRLLEENSVMAKAKLVIGEISRFTLKDEDITSSIIDFKMDLGGNITFKIKKEILEERDLINYIEKIEYKTNDIDGIGTMVSLSNKDKIFEYIVERNHLKVNLRLDQYQEKSTVALEGTTTE
ncbi:hypothetical protein [Priestia filamentosa]|uniref:hypothetical protein n=1 Tax=Priestia filamentosa TaxID=1402861 RepID=UPI00397DEBB7